MEREITVEVMGSYEDLHKDLTVLGFKKVNEYTLDDIYMIQNSIDVKNTPINQIFKECVLIRDVVGIEKKIVYKEKIVNDIGEIEKQYKTECLIHDIQQGINLFEKLNYRRLIGIKDKCIEYRDDSIQIIVQLVNEKYIFIEMEDQEGPNGMAFDSVYHMIDIFSKYGINYKKDNYFVKKAERVLQNK